LVFGETGDYEILYRSIDEHGNAEYANIMTISVIDRVVFAKVNQESAIIGDEGLETGSTATSTGAVSHPPAGEETNLTNGEVLGERTENEESETEKALIFAVLFLILASMTYLITRKQKV
jgi:hypothetical protein